MLEIQNKRGVSPVIGVILMVAITVILAAVIAVFVLGVGDSINDPAPNADFDTEYNTTGENVTITHNGGETVDVARLSVLDESGSELPDDLSGEELSAGDAFEVNYNESGTVATEIQLRWSSESGGNSQILLREEVPEQ